MAELAVNGEDFLYKIASSVLLIHNFLRFAMTLKVHNTAADAGFTLMEIVMVLVIVGILAALPCPSISICRTMPSQRNASTTVPSC